MLSSKLVMSDHDGDQNAVEKNKGGKGKSENARDKKATTKN